MNKIKFNFDRKPLSEDVINSKQDFQSILSTVKNTPKKSWTKYYYFGSVGLAGLAATIGIFKLIQNFNNIADGKNVTLNSNEITVLASNYKEDGQTVQLALNSTIDISPVTQESFLVDKLNSDNRAVVVNTASNCTSATKESEKAAVTSDFIIEEQEDTTFKSPKNSGKLVVPAIAGVSHGNIKWEDFKSNTIFVDNDYEVKQFSIQYTSRSGDRTIEVRGNTISPEILKELEQVGMNQTIFISNIISASYSNDFKHLLSMELNILFK